MKTEKFNPKTLQTFDKIVVKEYSNMRWRIDFFERIDGRFIIGLNGCYLKAVPYNEETKYLIGTNKECPECYKWWEE